ncbi:MAG: hypothetical protein ABR611_05770 [Chthoniobacterales bacterium]
MTIKVLLAVGAVSTTGFLSGCSFFHREPPLPRRAVIEAGGSEEKFADLIEEADIIYFPSEAARFGSHSDLAWKLLDALRRDAGSFAIAWDWTSNERERHDYLAEAGKAGAHLMTLNETGANGDQFAADKIATYFREHRNEKVLVFVRRERLGLGQGVPYLVAQETKARQLILNPRKSASAARLLARN